MEGQGSSPSPLTGRRAAAARSSSVNEEANLSCQLIDLAEQLNEALDNQELSDKLRKDLANQLEQEKKKNVEEQLKFAKEKGELVDKQLKLESLVDQYYQISRQFTEIVESMVGVISLDRGEISAVMVGMNQFSGILRALKEKIDLLEGDQDGGIGSVLVDLVTMGGVIRRMKLKMATGAITTTPSSNAANAEEMATPTPTTPSPSILNDGDGGHGQAVESDSGNQNDNCSEDIAIAQQLQLKEYGYGGDVRIEGMTFAEQIQFLEYKDTDDDVAVTEVPKKKQPKKPNPGTSSSSGFCDADAASASTTLEPVVPPSTSPPPVASTSSQLQAELLSLDTSSSSSCSRGDTGRLRRLPRKTYTDQLEDVVVGTSESEARPRRRQQSQSKSVSSPKKRQSCRSDEESSPIQKTRRPRRNYICPLQWCGKRFSRQKDWERHVLQMKYGRHRKTCGNRGESLEQNKNDEGDGGGTSSGSGAKEMRFNEKMAGCGEPCNQGGSSDAAVDDERLWTDGVTISVSRKRPKMMEPSSTSTSTSQVEKNLNKDGGIINSGGSGTAAALSPVSAPRVKTEPGSSATNQTRKNMNENGSGGGGGTGTAPGPAPASRIKTEPTSTSTNQAGSNGNKEGTAPGPVTVTAEGSSSPRIAWDWKTIHWASKKD